MTTNTLSDLHRTASCYINGMICDYVRPDERHHDAIWSAILQINASSLSEVNCWPGLDKALTACRSTPGYNLLVLITLSLGLSTKPGYQAYEGALSTSLPVEVRPPQERSSPASNLLNGGEIQVFRPT